MHIKRAKYDEYTRGVYISIQFFLLSKSAGYSHVHEFHQGSLVIGMACFCMAKRKRMWLTRMEIHETKTPAAVKLTSHQKTVMASLDRLMKLRRLKVMKRKTQA